MDNGINKKKILFSILFVSLFFAILGMIVLISTKADEKQGGSDEIGFVDALSDKDTDFSLDMNELKGTKVTGIPQYVISMDIGSPWRPHEYIQLLRRTENVICIGSMKDVETTAYEAGDNTWYISTFRVKVADPVRNCEAGGEYTVSTALRFYNGNYVADYGLTIGGNPDGETYNGETEGMFVLRKMADGTEYTVEMEGGDKIRLTDQAEYYLDSFFKCDGNWFGYSYTDIMVDEIREGATDSSRLLPEGDILEMVFEPLSGQDKFTVKDEGLIGVVWNYLNSLELEPVDTEYPEAEGGWNCYMTFTYSDHHKETIYYYDDVYVTNLKNPWYKIKSIGNESLEDVFERIKKW